MYALVRKSVRGSVCEGVACMKPKMRKTEANPTVRTCRPISMSTINTYYQSAYNTTTCVIEFMNM